MDASPWPYAPPPQDPTAPETDAKGPAQKLAIWSFLVGLASLLLCPFVGQAGAAALAFASQRKTKAAGAGTLGLAKLGYGLGALGLVSWSAVAATHQDPPKRQAVVLEASAGASTTRTTERQAAPTTTTPASVQPLLSTAPPTTAAPASVAVIAPPPTMALPATTAAPRTVAPTTAKATTTVRPTTTAATAPPTTNANDHVYANCADLHTEHPHGVGRTGASDHTTSGHPVTTFEVNDRLYLANRSKDADDDGIACEAA